MKLEKLLWITLSATASPLRARQSDITARVDFSGTRGTPQQLASGILYGTPDTLNQIPDRFYTDPKLKRFRAGGAQLFNVGQRGWNWREYPARFQSTLNNYRTARKYNGEFQLLPHDIWGTDTTNSSSVWPGDNGDWRDYDAFLDQLIADITVNKMVPGLKIDIWNEPDIGLFWNRPLAQYLELWRRSYNKFRLKLLTTPIVGPSLNAQPSQNNDWWVQYMKYITKYKIAPDEYTWHILGPSDDPNNDLQANNVTMYNFFASTGAPKRPYCINEYINAGDERMNAAEAWHIARLERYDTPGLRANWLNFGELHDYLAELVYRPDSSSPYQPNGAWQLYRYYAQNMTGIRLPTTGSPDGVLDVFVTMDNTNTQGKPRTVRILTGVRARVGTWEIRLENLPAVGFPANGTLNVTTYGFDDVGTRGVSTGASYRNVFGHTITNGIVSFPIFQTNEDYATAWAFEFNTP